MRRPPRSERGHCGTGDRRIDHDIGMRDEIDMARHLSELEASLCNSVLAEATIASAHGGEQSPIG
jgi:hypothetical protein